MSAKRVSVILFELSLVFLFLQQNVFPSELTMVSMLSVIAAGIWMKFVRKDLRYFCLNPFLDFYAVFLVIMLIGCLCGMGTGDTWRRTILCAGGWVTSVLMYDCLMNMREPERFMKLYLDVAIVSLVVILLLLGDKSWSSRLGHNGSGGNISYYIGSTPIYKSSNGTANVCVIAAAFAYYFAAIKRMKRYYLYCVFLLIGMMMTGSRKGILIFAIVAAYLVFFWDRGVTWKKLWLAVIIPVAGLIVVTKVPAVYDAIGKRIVSLVLNLLGQANKLDGNSYLARMDLMGSAIQWFIDRPLFGHGMNAFSTYYEVGTESNILQLLVDFGIVGFLAYYAFLPGLYCRLKACKNGSKLARMFGIIIISFLMQDVFSVRYSWHDCTMWFSIYWFVTNCECNSVAKAE